MVQHARLFIVRNLSNYFRDPRSPWQRHSNENTYGLLRSVLPEKHRPELFLLAIDNLPK